MPVRLFLALKALAVSFNRGPSSESSPVFKALETSELVLEGSQKMAHIDTIRQ